MHKTVAVIIPFYQEQPGILAKAIASALEQRLPPGVSLWVIIVDDESPISVQGDMIQVAVPDTAKVTIHTVDRNGGPGAARNRGIDIACSEGATYCAFLDSDDIWLGSHLINAITMLDQGSDVYFSDHRRQDDYTSAFASGAPIFWNSYEVREAIAGKDAADGSDTNFVLHAEFVRDSLVCEYLYQTSTVVFRLDSMGSIRFDGRLRSAGEDHLFWFDLASAATQFAVSSAVEVECGYGVNVYFESFSWKSPRSVDRYGYRYVMLKEMQARGVLRKRELTQLRHERVKMRNTYAYLFVRHLFRGTLPNWTLLRVATSKALGVVP